MASGAGSNSLPSRQRRAPMAASRRRYILKTPTARAEQDDSDLECTDYPVLVANLPEITSGAAPPASANSFITAFLEDARSCFTDTPINFDLACTATEQRTCQIVPRVSVWNELLCQARLQLRELSGARGQLALVAAETRCLPKPTKEERIQAAALVYWLLTTHRCVASADISGFEGHDQLICDAFWANSSVKTLKFDSGSMKIRQNLFAFVSLLEHVEEIECTTSRDCADECLVGSLGSLLRSTTSLRSLKLSTLRIGPDGALRLMEDFMANSTVKELSVHSSIAYCSAFRDYLRCTVNLKSLSVSTGLAPRRWTLKPILTGLLENESVTDVTLEDFMVEWESAELVFKLLAQNPALRTFHVTFARCALFSRPSANYCLWVAALGENDALKEVTLPLGILRPQQWESVFEALSTNESVKKLTIQLDNVLKCTDLPELCRLVQKSGADGKVTLGNCISDDIDVLACKASSEAFIWSRFFTDSSQMLKVVRSLPAFDHVTSLNLEAEASDFGEELFSVVADYISSTDSLKKLCLEVWGQGVGGSWKAIVQALSQNASIRKVQLYADTVCLENAESLADVVNASRTISTFGFNVLNPCEVGAFTRRLSVAVRDNYTLIKLILRGEIPADSAANWFTVWDTVRRNAGLVAFAAQFVTGSRRDGYCARALELVWSHPGLLKQVTKLASVTEDEASAMVRKSLRDIASMLAFMQMAGVVKSRLECHPREDGRPQLDDLNDDCQRLLRSYLKISDVRGTM